MRVGRIIPFRGRSMAHCFMQGMVNGEGRAFLPRLRGKAKLYHSIVGEWVGNSDRRDKAIIIIIIIIPL